MDIYRSTGYISMNNVWRCLIWCLIDISIEISGGRIHITAPLLEVETIGFKKIISTRRPAPPPLDAGTHHLLMGRQEVIDCKKFVNEEKTFKWKVYEIKVAETKEDTKRKWTWAQAGHLVRKAHSHISETEKTTDNLRFPSHDNFRAPGYFLAGLVDTLL